MTPDDTVAIETPMLDFPLADDIVAMVEAIRQSRATDPAVFALQGLEIFLHMSYKPEPERPSEINMDIRALCRALVRAKPDCAPLVNLANDMIKPLADFYARGEGDRMREDLRARAEQWREELLWREGQRILKAATLVKDGTKLLCHGFSNEIVGGLREAKSKGVEFSVTCTVGHPRQEGRALAEELTHHEIAAQLVSDEAAPAAVGQATLVLVGADSLSEQGLAYRAGTFALARAAQEVGVPFYALCGPEKFFPAGYKHHATASTVEFGPGWDITPLEYLTGVVTGEATLSAEVLREVLAKRPVESLLLG